MVAGNLRAPITAVGPILSEIKTVLSLNTSEASLLTSIPLAVFAFCSIMISRIAGKGNIRHSLIYTCVALVLGLAMRVYGNVTMLYIGSIVMGLGICIGNVTTPAYIKQAFPNHIGLMTGIFSVSMNLIAAMASGLSLSIGQWTGLGWKGSLGVWTFWSVLALLVVLLDSFMASPVQRATRTKRVDSIRIFRSNQAWNISFFYGGAIAGILLFGCTFTGCFGRLWHAERGDRDGLVYHPNGHAPCYVYCACYCLKNERSKGAYLCRRYLDVLRSRYAYSM